jgi:TolB-like protein
VERYRVGDVVVDVPAGTASRAGRAVPLPPLTFNLLVALIRRAPQLIRREELLATVWPNEFVSDETLSQRASLLRRALGDRTGDPRYIASVRGWGYKLVASVERIAPEEKLIEAVAVLPLANLTGDGEQDHLADGLTDALITSLSKLHALKVISRTSVMRYRHTEKTLPAIARELDVQAIVEGSVLRDANRLWVTVQLVNGATDSHLWSESYERDIGDVPALLDEVASKIADAISIAVSPDEQRRLRTGRRVDPAACEEFLRGAHFLGKYTPADTGRAIAHLNEAIRLAPDFAWAHAALGGAYVMSAVPFGVGLTATEQHVRMALAKAAAERAAGLDETLATAYAVLGTVLMLHEWDWRRACDVLERAIRLEPSCSAAHMQRALVAAWMLDGDVAAREGDRAVELDPLNLGVRAQCAENRYWVRDYDGAIRGALETLAFDPAFPRAHFVLGRVYEAQCRIREAIDHYWKAGLLTPSLAKDAGGACKRGGARGFHQWALKVGLGAQGGPAAGTGARLRPLWKAKLHGQAGNIQLAIDCLEEAYAERDALLVLLKTDIFDPLRGHPRFEEIVRRVGIPSHHPQ